MTKNQWLDIKFFHPREFDSPDMPGSGDLMQWEIMARLDRIREDYGRPIYINSGVRTAAHNAAVGGVDSSAHVGGFAADIRASDSRSRMELVALALKHGIKRIGIAGTFIHVDADPALPQNCLWLYSAKS